MSETPPADPIGTPPARRPRRQRGLTESLLSIVLGMEAAVLFFFTLVVFGLKILEPAPAFIGGGGAFVLVLLLAGLQRHRWAVWAGGAVQLGLISLGLLAPVMLLLGAGFAALWLWCLLRGRQVDRARASASVEGTDPADEGAAS